MFTTDGHYHLVAKHYLLYYFATSDYCRSLAHVNPLNHPVPLVVPAEVLAYVNHSNHHPVPPGVPAQVFAQVSLQTTLRPRWFQFCPKSILQTKARPFIKIYQQCSMSSKCSLFNKCAGLLRFAKPTSIHFLFCFSFSFLCF